MAWNVLKAVIAQTVRANGNNEITGDNLQVELFRLIDELGLGFTYAGLVYPGFSPGTIDGNVFFLATQPGTYVDIVITQKGLYAIRHANGLWSKDDLIVQAYSDADLALTIRKTLQPYFLSSYQPTASPYNSPSLTSGVATKIDIPFSNKGSNQIQYSVSGNRFQYLGSANTTLSFTLVTGIKANNDGATFNLELRKNGVLVPGVRSIDQMAKKEDIDNTVLVGDIFNVEPNDYFEVFITSTINTFYQFTEAYISFKE